MVGWCAFSSRDLHAGRRHGIPETTELVELLSIGLARCGVADVVVERMSVVGDLPLTAGRRAQQRCERAGSDVHCGRRRERRPDAAAATRARRCGAAVSREEIQRSTLSIAQERAETRRGALYAQRTHRRLQRAIGVAACTAAAVGGARAAAGGSQDGKPGSWNRDKWKPCDG